MYVDQYSAGRKDRAAISDFVDGVSGGPAGTAEAGGQPGIVGHYGIHGHAVHDHQRIPDRQHARGAPALCTRLWWQASSMRCFWH